MRPVPDLAEAVLGDAVRGNWDNLFGGVRPFLPGETETDVRPGDCMGLVKACGGGLDGVESLDPDREEALLEPP